MPSEFFITEDVALGDFDPVRTARRYLRGRVLSFVDKDGELIREVWQPYSIRHSIPEVVVDHN